MLTATYTLVALSVEQSNVRLGLASLQKYVQANLMHQNSITLGQMEYACDALNHLYQACRWRKVEMFLIPAIRQATQRADALLDELATLNGAALDIIHALRARVGAVATQNEDQVAQICASIDSFCSTLLQRLEKEEQELFAIARGAICGEAWFSIANQFLLHDAREVETRRAKPSKPSMLALAACTPAALRAPEDGAASGADEPVLKVAARK